jgi:uncharacterized protein YjgD (DUF1641 family)
VAKQDILTEFEEKHYEEHTEAENEYYNKLYGEHVEQVIDAYLNHLGSAYAVKKKTSEEKRNEICNVIKLVDKTRMYHTYSNPKVGCVTILLVMLDFWKDIDASIFLSVHGKYRPANALLRRWLETFITALYFDAELKKCDKDIIKKRDEWLKEAPHRRFTGNGSILGTLIDPDTDDIATQLMNETTSFSHSSFREYVKSLYGNLSKHVHFGGQHSLEDWPKCGFAEYDEKLFEEWYDRLNQINEICNILTLLKFPEITGSDSDVDVVNAIIERCEREDKKLNEVVDELIRKGLERE